MERFTDKIPIGEGSFGSIELCHDISTGENVVVKKIPNCLGTSNANSFQREVEALRLLDHPNIVKYIDSFSDEKHSYIVMEYVDGGNLGNILKNGPIDELVGVKILFQTTSALACIHEKKIVHKDIKPENILLSSDGNVKIADFGISKILKDSSAFGETLSLTRDYTSPELLTQGKYTTKYDIFSLGVVAYQMFTGILPFENQGKMRNGNFKQFPETMDRFLVKLIGKMLNPDPKSRISAHRVLTKLRKAYGEIRSGMRWRIEKKKLVIYGLGPIPNFKNELSAPWNDQKENIQKITMLRGVQTIGNFAFCRFNKLVSIKFKTELKSIGGAAFMGCSQLKSISFPNSLTHIGAAAFENCTSLRVIELPAEIDTIRNWTFSGCSKLESINMENVRTFGEDAFRGTPILTWAQKYTDEDPDFLCELGLMYARNQTDTLEDERAFMMFKRSLAKGCVSSIYALALCFKEGRGTVRNDEAANFFFDVSINAGNSELLDSLCINMPKMTSEEEQGCLEIISSFGGNEASYKLGMLAKDIDEKKAFEYFQKAAVFGHTNSVYELALCFRKGKGTEKNREEALSYLQLAAENGHPDASSLIGKFYETGKKFPMDIERAAEYYRNAVRHGNYDAMLGYFRCIGQGVEVSQEEKDQLILDISERALSIYKGNEWSVESGINWTFDSTRSVLVLRGGQMNNYDEEHQSPWSKRFKYQTRSVIACDGISSISDMSFYEFSGLTAIVLPDSLKNVGRRAFYNCIALVSVLLQEGVERIGDGAFSGCRSLGKISIPSTVKSIGNVAFHGCISLKSVELMEGLLSIGIEAFSGCEALDVITIPASVNEIIWNPFSNCKSLASIGVADGSHAFTSMDGVLFNSIQTKIISYPGAKSGSYDIPSSVVSVGDCAFEGCNQLSSVNIHSEVVIIGANPFIGCTHLLSIEVSDDNLDFLSCEGVLFNKHKTQLIACKGTKEGEYQIPDSVVSIGIYAFKGCKQLTAITIPDKIRSISVDSFDECPSLKTITIPRAMENLRMKLPKSAKIMLRDPN